MNPGCVFTKMHGLGNDYVLIDARIDPIPNPEQLARAISDRHCGVGSDGLILILPTTDPQADVRMRIFNIDGSEAEMCGNRIRCLGKYICEHDSNCAGHLRVQTKGGIVPLEFDQDRDGCVLGGKGVGGGVCVGVTVNMGEPRYERAAIRSFVIPAEFEGCNSSAYECRIKVGEITWAGIVVVLGNPHIVLFQENNALLQSVLMEEWNVPDWGRAIELHPAFPQRINVHFVQVKNPEEVVVRTWERGSGETRACGTGAGAVCVAGGVMKLAKRDITVHMPGGTLQASWNGDTGHIVVAGPAMEVFQGQWFGDI